ncbi:MAG: low affinity iron permease family protein [Pyrinomonadaceae bacterium]
MVHENKSLFTKFAKSASVFAGHPSTFIGAVLILIIWGISGPIFAFSDTWQLIINTGTTIITFLMVFLIQNTQNRDTEAIHVKLDELIRSHRSARNAVMNLEEFDEKELDAFRQEYLDLAEKAHSEMDERKKNK